jgi:hypothetical protein
MFSSEDAQIIVDGIERRERLCFSTFSSIWPTAVIVDWALVICAACKAAIRLSRKSVRAVDASLAVSKSSTAKTGAHLPFRVLTGAVRPTHRSRIY